MKVTDITTTDFTARTATQPGQFLSLARLAEICPAAFAERPADKVSELYQFVPSTEIIERLDGYGFKPVAASNPVSKHGSHGQGKLELSRYGPHLIQFEPVAPVELAPQCYLRVALLNSHDTSRRLRLTAGVWRKVCSNGLMVAISAMGLVETHLVLNMLGLDEQMERVLTHARQLPKAISAWNHRQLTKPAQLKFATAAMALRFGDRSRWSIKPEQLLGVRRPADAGDDLWTVFNRVQENASVGGIRSERTHFHTVELTRPRQTFDFNIALWNLAEDSYAGTN